MKRILVSLALAYAANAGGGATSRVLDGSLTAAQRNDACLALRGDRSAEAIRTMRAALGTAAVRACAARNLAEAGAVGALASGLAEPDPDVRVAAAGELGRLAPPEAMEPLARAAADANVLVAASAVEALGHYQDPVVLPYLLRIAERPDVAGLAALRRAAQFRAPGALAAARKILSSGAVAAQVIALEVIGDLGGRSDLPRLRELASKSEVMRSRGRGFGLMPPVDVGRAAQNAMAAIEKRLRTTSQ